MRRLALLCCVLSPPSAAAQAPLAWKFASGDAFFLQRDTTAEQVLKVKERTLKQTVQRATTFRVDVVKPLTERAELRLTLENIQVQHSAGKASVENKLLEKMRGAAFMIEVTPQGRLKNLTGYEDLVNQVAEKKDDVAKVVRQLWPEALFRQEFEELFAVVPERTVAVGDRWEEKDTLLLPPMGSFALQRKKAYIENDRAGHAHLAATWTGKYEPPAQPADLFRVVAGDLALEKAVWECTFDRSQGRALRSATRLQIQGPVTLELMGMTTVVELTLHVEMVTKLLAKTP